MITVYSAFSNACKKYLDADALRIELTARFCHGCYALLPNFGAEDIFKTIFFSRQFFIKLTENKEGLYALFGVTD